jgi:hypothetical protein
MTKTKQYIAFFMLLSTIDLMIYAHDGGGPWGGTLFAILAGLAGITFVQMIAPVTVKTVKVSAQTTKGR